MIGFYLVALGCAIALLYQLGRNAWASKRKPRGERHDLKVAVATEWLRDPEILEVARKVGMTPAGLDRYRNMLGTVGEAEVDILITKFLTPRLVRRAVAKHMQKQGGNRADAMKRLYGFVKTIEGQYDSA